MFKTKGYHVYQGYSAQLILTELSINNEKREKLQVLERQDKKKWVFLNKRDLGNGGPPKLELRDFFSSSDAISEFENRFRKLTKNVWGEGFKLSPGNYEFVSEEASETAMR